MKLTKKLWEKASKLRPPAEWRESLVLKKDLKGALFGVYLPPVGGEERPESDPLWNLFMHERETFVFEEVMGLKVDGRKKEIALEAQRHPLWKEACW